MESCLEDVIVLEFSDGWSSAALCGRLLSELGARVIKVEPATGDSLRFTSPARSRGEALAFQSLSSNKQSLALTLENGEGKEILAELIGRADIAIVDAHYPARSAMPFDQEEAGARNPQIIHCHFSTFGRHGPLQDYVGNDLVAQAMGGIISTTGHPKSLPHKSGPPLAVHATALMGGIAILGALDARESIGKGQAIDMAMYDCMVSFLYTFIPGYFLSGKAPEPLGNKHPMSAPWDTYQASDGWVIVTMGDDRQWHNFLNLIGRPELIGNERYLTNDQRTQPDIRVEVDGLVGDWIADKTMDEVIRVLRENKIPAGPIHDIGQLLADDQFLGRGMVQELEHPTTGKYVAVGSMFQMSATPGRVFSPSPGLGQHSAAVLGEFCRYAPAHIERLKTAGVIATGGD